MTWGGSDVVVRGEKRVQELIEVPEPDRLSLLQA